MSKRPTINIKSLFLLFLILIYQVGPAVGLIKSVNAATVYSIEFNAVDDTFVSPSTLNPANGTRRSLFIGSYTDYTIPGNPLFYTSHSLIKFGTLSLPAGAIVTNVRLRLWHYGTNAGNGTLYVAKATSGWNGNTIWGGPSYSGDYGSATFPNYNSNFSATLREITLSNSAYYDMTSANEGFVVKNYNDTDPGVVVCSSDIPSGPCQSGDNPKLYVEYIVNQQPNQPALDYPDNLWEIGPKNNGILTGINCTTGSGCNVDFRADGEDPDHSLPLNNTYEIRSSEGGNVDYTNSGEGWQVFTRHLNDGHWSWKGYSIDTYGANSGYSPTKSFIVDTTAPAVPVVQTEPQFTAGLQNTVSTNVVTDNIIGGVQYYFEISQDPTFTTVLNNSGWVSTNSFTFGLLTDNQTYYYRAKAKDALDNTTTWSNVESSTQDAVLPVLNNISVPEGRISPQNQDGVKDSSTISFDWTELNPSSAKIELIKAADGMTVKQYDFTNPSTTPITQTWDGKDSSNNFVSDGTYNVKITFTDKAGNQTVDNSQYIVIDNTPGTLSINQADGSWYNSNTIGITGQAENNATLDFTNTTTAENQTPTPNSTTGLFGIAPDPLINFTLNLGRNDFDFKTWDSVGNQNQILRSYFYENVAPSINISTPATLTNNNLPSITLNLTDTGYDDGTNNYISGIDTSKVNLTLKHSDSSEFDLITNGTNVSSLGNFTTDCNSSGTFGNSGPASCTLTYTFTSALTPDGSYTLSADVKDKAANSSQLTAYSFELDTHTVNTITQPSNGNLFNYSKIQLKGTAEKSASLNISLPDLDGNLVSENLTFTVEEGNPSTPLRVTINNCRASTTPTQDGIKEICDYTVNDFQLEKNSTPGNLSNPIKFVLTDSAGNVDTRTITVNEDLYAVTLGLNTDRTFFSPNGDGKQDGVTFQNIQTNGFIDFWTLRLLDSSNTEVKSFTGNGTLPTNIPWDGRDNNGNFVPGNNSNGNPVNYTYVLSVTTTDNLTFSTTPVTITAANLIKGNVIITTPENNSYSTRGAINVQGQAPIGTIVRICDDVIGLPSSCDVEQNNISVDSNGFFSIIFPLESLGNLTDHYLTATASDRFGNTTPDSNKVKVTLTVKPPFDSVSVIPAYSGVNDPAAYQLIIDRLNNNQTITMADILSLRSVIFRSVVNQGTERVLMSFGDYSNLSELPSPVNQQYMGWIDSNNQTHLYENYPGTGTPCPTTTCTQDFYYPVPSGAHGLYEIFFNGKLGSTVEEVSAPLIVDGNIPAAPMILTIDKVIGGQTLAAKLVNDPSSSSGQVYYSNSQQIIIKGVSDPNAAISIIDQNNNVVCSTTSSVIGLFVCPTTVGYVAPESDYSLKVSATLGANTALSLSDTKLVVDKQAPTATLNTFRTYFQSGSQVEMNLTANEALSAAYHINNTTQTCINNSLSDDVVTDLLINNNIGTGSTVLNGNLVEGKYCSHIDYYDLAGNVSSIDMILSIDNTKPDVPTIDTSTWGIYNGINAKPGFIAAGRLNPGFVTKDNSITISGLSEENQKVELYVNGNLISSTNAADRTNPNCIGSATNDIIADSVLVKSGFNCPYTFTYTFASGEVGYNIQVRAQDYALNYSLISQSKLVYYDLTKPVTPETDKVSSNGNQIVDWQISKNQDVTASALGTGNFGKLPITNQKSVDIQDYAESLSDTVHTSLAPNGTQIEQSLMQKSGNGVDVRNFGLNYGDGVYTFYAQSWDAPGNVSDVHMFQMELDTVAPTAPNVSLSQDFNGIYMFVQGEPGSSSLGSLGGKLNANGTISGTVKILDINNDADWERWYTFCSTLQDRATNQSGQVCRSIPTPTRPDRPGECDINIDDKILQISNGSVKVSDAELYNYLGYSKSCQTYKKSLLDSNILNSADKADKLIKDNKSCIENKMVNDKLSVEEATSRCDSEKVLGENRTKNVIDSVNNQIKEENKKQAEVEKQQAEARRNVALGIAVFGIGCALLTAGTAGLAAPLCLAGAVVATGVALVENQNVNDKQYTVDTGVIKDSKSEFFQKLGMNRETADSVSTFVNNAAKVGIVASAVFVTGGTALAIFAPTATLSSLAIGIGANPLSGLGIANGVIGTAFSANSLVSCLDRVATTHECNAFDYGVIGVSWVASAVSLGVGAQQAMQSYNLVTALKQANNVDTATKLKTIAQEADQNIATSGNKTVDGTLKHSYAQDMVDGLDNPNLVTEKSYLNGVEVPRGTPGSVRLDVTELDPVTQKPIAVYDYKFGVSGLTDSRILQIRNALQIDDIPVIEIRP